MKELLIEKWDEIIDFLRDECGIKSISYKTWLKPLKIRDVVDGKVIIYNSDELNGSSASFIQSRYGSYIKGAIAEVTDQEFDIEIVDATPSQARKTLPEKNVSSYNSGITLNSSYTFDNFVVSNTNSMVHAAALKVAEAPGEYYNPLFIYGDSGLGKTHLMNAIAHFIIENSPDKKVMYVTSEKFTNDLVESFRHGSVSPADFKEKYRNVDILLIDDIQFIIGKSSTQEEFFHTFNYLYDARKQIVISSDKPPRDFDDLEERLRSRFECGLIVDIIAPDFETKMAILKKKLEMRQQESGLHIDVDDECLAYIANNINTNIRSLEGALTKVLAYANLNHLDVDMEVVEKSLHDVIFPNKKKVITPAFIIDVVAEHFEINVSEIYSDKRDNRIVIPRQIAMYLSRKHTDCSTLELENVFKRDHSTVLHGIKAIENKITNDPEIAAKVDVLTKKLNCE